MAYDQRTADVERELETANALLIESERMRDSLRLQVAAAEYTRHKDNEFLLGKVDRLRDALGLLRGYVEMDSEGWRIINDALAPGHIPPEEGRNDA